jgi:hypothetical protein
VTLLVLYSHQDIKFIHSVFEQFSQNFQPHQSVSQQENGRELLENFVRRNPVSEPLQPHKVTIVSSAPTTEPRHGEQARPPPRAPRRDRRRLPSPPLRLRRRVLQ